MKLRILIVIVAFTIGLFLCELGFRIWLFGAGAFSVVSTNSAHDIGVSGLVQASRIPEIIYELKPDIKDAYFKLAPFETNSMGLRDREYTFGKPPQTVRVAVIGDSYTMPSGVPIEDAYHTRIEKKLNAGQNHDTKYEFINFGVGGYDLRQYAAVIEHKAMPMNPDMILIGFCGINDYHPSDARFSEKYVPKSKINTFWSFFLWQATENLFAKLSAKPFVPGSINRGYVAKYFSRIRSVVDPRVPIVVAFLDYRRKPAASPQEIRELAESYGLKFVDASSVFRNRGNADNRDKSEYWIYPLDPHPNVRANEIFADTILPFLLSEIRLLSRIYG